MKNKKRTIFLTGGTGLIGSYLLKIFLRNNHKVYALTRSSGRKSAHKKIDDVLNFWGQKIPPEKLTVLEGDITKRGLGLNKRVRLKLQKEVDEIFHCAAVTDLHKPIGYIRKTNVLGTKHVFNLARQLNRNGKQIKVNHISTAYIYGDYKGRFCENDLFHHQHFGTNYEKTKFEAERLVNRYRKKGLNIDIYRPSIVIGDSKTGKTFQFKHIYQFIEICRLGLFGALPVKDSYASIVPVDSLAKAIYKISEFTKEKNKNYHPFPTSPISIKNLISAGSRILKFKSPQIVSARDFNMNKLTFTQKAILRNSILSVNLKINLDSAFTNAILNKLNFQFPKFDKQSLARTLTYYLKNKHN